MTLRVGVIGTGTIAAPMVRSILRRLEHVEIVLSPRSVHISESLSTHSQVSVAHDNQKVLDATDTVLLCLLAEVAREVLPDLSFRSDHRIVSVMVDYSVEDLLIDCQPAKHIELTMPLPFIETGGCPLPCYPTADIVEELYGDDNIITVLNTTEAMQPHIAVAGIVSAFLQGVEQISSWLGEKTGKPEEAEPHVLNLLSGYLKSVNRDGEQRINQAIGDLSTKGGLNAQFRQALIDAGYFQTMNQELDRLLDRLSDSKD